MPVLAVNMPGLAGKSSASNVAPPYRRKVPCGVLAAGPGYPNTITASAMSPPFGDEVLDAVQQETVAFAAIGGGPIPSGLLPGVGLGKAKGQDTIAAART